MTGGYTCAMEKRVATTLRLPDDLMEEIRQIAAEEERALNTQILRFIRAGLEQYRAQRQQPERQS
jgi:hypothetical protein